MADLTPFTNLITSEHADKPQFVEMVGLSCQPFVELADRIALLSLLYDIDQAVGSQLDVVGQWVGRSRNLDVPITNVYFTLDLAGVGFDEGIWMGAFDPSTGLVSLPDEHYRLLLKARVLNNRWDCDIPDAYILSNIIFGPLGYQIIIEDHQDLSMDLGLIGVSYPDPLTLALLTGGYLNLKPAGVRILYYYTQTVPGPLFALDMDTPLFSGFDSGGWTLITPA